MGERKVLNKYYPPDFDPSKIPKKKRAKNDQVKVRMMLPMSIRCNTCGEYLYRGKKFNSRKETVTGEEYLGLRIFRFYIKCTRCSAELTIKTDPRNSDYQCEFGASRNFEPWRENQKVLDDAKDKREKEEMGDAMKALENRTLDSKIEMDILDALDEIRSLNARQSKMDPVDVLLARQKEIEDEDRRLNEEDEELVKNMFGESGSVHRIIDDGNYDDEKDGGLLKALELEPIFKLSKKIKEEKKEDDNEYSSSSSNVFIKSEDGGSDNNNNNNILIKKSNTNDNAAVVPKVSVKVQVKVVKKEEGSKKADNTTTNNNNNNNQSGDNKQKKSEPSSMFSLLEYGSDDE